MDLRIFISCLSVLLLLAVTSEAQARHEPMQQRESGSFHSGVQSSKNIAQKIAGNCSTEEGYVVYLIDNFDQELAVLPEVAMTHGKLVQAMLLSGRSDINVHVLNTSLRKGLTDVYEQLTVSGCGDAVVSSIPGSNYTYGQISSLLAPGTRLHSENILEHRQELLELMLEIASSGFPSVAWLKRAKVNPIKLREDAKKLLYIELLGEMGIPVFLPYGNPDSPYRGEPRTINLLSLSRYARVFSGGDANGKHLPGYPHSPLSSGDALANYRIAECPDYDDVRITHIDINNDGHVDFSVDRSGAIPYYDERGELSHTPSFLDSGQFTKLLEQIRSGRKKVIKEELVLTRQQYAELLDECPTCPTLLPPQNHKEVVWLNSTRYGQPYWFSPQCQNRGTISGTSLIPPVKAREALPLRN